MTDILGPALKCPVIVNGKRDVVDLAVQPRDFGPQALQLMQDMRVEVGVTPTVDQFGHLPLMVRKNRNDRNAKYHHHGNDGLPIHCCPPTSWVRAIKVLWSSTANVTSFSCCFMVETSARRAWSSCMI